jgi:hypothetical protein
MIHEAPLNFGLTANQSPSEGRVQQQQEGKLGPSLPTPGDAQEPLALPGGPSSAL